MFDGEFYKMGEQLERELDELAQRRPSLLPGRHQRQKFPDLAARLERVIKQMRFAAEEAAQSIADAFTPVAEAMSQAIRDMGRRYEQMQRAQLHGRLKARLRFLPARRLEAPLWWLCRLWPRRWLPPLDIDEVLNANGRRGR